MTEAKKNHLRVNRYARFKYLFRGGKHKINRFEVNRTIYTWISTPTVYIPRYDRESGYHDSVESIIENSLDFYFAVSAHNDG